MLGLPEELLYLRPVQLLSHISPLPGGKRQFVDLCHERRELALESEGWERQNLTRKIALAQDSFQAFVKVGG